MKSVFIFIGGFVAAIVLLFVGGYLAMDYFSGMAEEHHEGWIPDFEQRSYKSAAELAAAKTEYERWVAIGDVALWSVDLNLLERSSQMAHETLRIAEKYKKDWNYGNAIHKAHLALGRVALRKDNIEEAKKQLLLAGNTPGSPQLDSFGPNMLLAKELLEKGEREVVLEYLELCAEFWDLHLERLIAWEEKIKKGESPGFGSNLLY